MSYSNYIANLKAAELAVAKAKIATSAVLGVCLNSR